MQTWLNLQDKIIIVTGGASGIGLAIVEELLAQGANVQMVDIHGGDGQYESHKGYQFWPTDISSAKEVNHTVAEIIQRFGRIDGLVNNAGVNFPRLLVDEKAAKLMKLQGSSSSKELGKHGIRVVGIAPGILENRTAHAGI